MPSTQRCRSFVASGMNPTVARVAADPQVAGDIALATARLELRNVEPAFVGGRGLVCRATQRATGETVALKVPAYPRQPDLTPGHLRASIAKEADALKAIESPHLPRLRGAHCSGRYLLRDYVEGPSVTDLAAASGGGADLAYRVLAAAADLFPKAHDHVRGPHALRDFKPRNLHVDCVSGRVVLVDMGGVRSLAAMAGMGRADPMRLGSGAWCHWAPEQLLGDRGRPGLGVDFFALGTTLCFCLLAQYPYSNSEADGEAARYKYREEHALLALRLSDTAHGSKRLRSFVCACAHPEAEERPGLDELEAVALEEGAASQRVHRSGALRKAGSVGWPRPGESCTESPCASV